MKKSTQKIIHLLSTQKGTLKGGFSSLTEKQMSRIKGGGSNGQCTNGNCGHVSNSVCSNQMVCSVGSNTRACTNTGDCRLGPSPGNGSVPQ